MSTLMQDAAPAATDPAVRADTVTAVRRTLADAEAALERARDAYYAARFAPTPSEAAIAEAAVAMAKAVGAVERASAAALAWRTEAEIARDAAREAAALEVL